MRIGRSLSVGLLFVVLVQMSYAEVPLNNLEGVGGIAFNPLAYLAGKPADTTAKGGALNYVSKPQIGGWFVNLHEVNVDWSNLSVATSFFKRVEVSYGFQTIAPAGANIHKNNLGAKLLLLKENAGGTKFLPAISIGSIWKKTSQVASSVDDSAADFYLVASKLITQAPKPILLSGGLLSTRGRATGVFGYDKDRKATGYANVDLVVHPKLALGYEFKQGAQFNDWKDAHYWNLHSAVFVNKHFTLVAAYVYAGNSSSVNHVGLGDGLVLSGHYAF